LKNIWKQKKNKQEFLITIEEQNGRSKHTVILDDGYYQNLTDKKISKEELVRMSLVFLLQRESKESILSEFNLKIIKKYFPEYENKIKHF